MMNKRGISGIVVTLIMILLVLVLAGIIWIVVRTVVEGGSEEITLGTQCLQIDIRATAVNCTIPSSCDVTLTRKVGGGEISGVKLVFRNSVGDSSSVIDVPKNISELLTIKETGIDSVVTSPNKVEVTAYFKDTSGNDQPCGQTNSFSF